MSAEVDLLNAIKAYELGYNSSIGVAQQTGVINPVAMGALTSITGVDVAAIAKDAQQVQDALANMTGAGSVVTRVFAAATDLSGNPLMIPFKIAQAMFGGRTFNTDNYYGASDFSYYVKGIDVGSSVHVTDADVLPAMKWFVDKTGVFISGRAHINALRQSAGNYIAMYAQNNLTTQDPVRVQNAVRVVQQYMTANFVKGGWANCVGVYDNVLLGIANASPATLAALKQKYQATDEISAGGLLSSGSVYLYVAILIIIVIIYLMVRK